MSKVRPMLAAAVKLEEIMYPAIASKKLDGIRGIVHDSMALTRTLKSIPNSYVRDMFSSEEFNGFDGEFIVGSPTASDAYRKTNSALMTRTGKPDATFYVFDDMSIPSDPYVDRLNRLKSRVGQLNHPSIVLLEQVMVVNVYEMTNYEEILIGKGYEGVIVRHPMGRYKYGRSTVSQGWLVKLKRFMDSEAVILGSVELMENKNEAVVNELGYMGRSSHMENKVPGGRLGAFKVCDTLNGWDFEIGTGFSEAERIAYWKQRESLVGKVVKYKYFAIGMKDVPRHPSFIGFRDSCDM